MSDARPNRDAQQLKQRGRAVIDALAGNEFHPDRFEFADDMDDPLALSDAWRELTGIFGEFKETQHVEYHDDRRETHVRFTLSTAEFRAEVAFDEDGAITDLPIKKCDDGGRLSTVTDLGRVARHAVSKRLSVWTDGNTTDSDTDIDTDPTPDRAETISRQFFQGEFETVNDQFGPGLQLELPPERLADLWEHSLSDRVGTFEGINNVHYNDAEREATVHIDCTGAPTKAELHFDADGAVNGFLVTRSNGDPDEAVSYEPPAYVDSDAISEHETTVECDGYQLGGTLTLPTGGGPYPGVIIVHGSGPSDRNASTGPNRPFQDLAWGLATHGIATLRYDKRSYVTGWEIEPGETPDDETVRDAVAAVETLRAAANINADNLVVVGHSLGGSLAPRIARRSNTVGGVVCLAATPRHAIDVIVDQVAFLATVDEPYGEEDRDEFRDVTNAAKRIKAGDFADDEWIVDHPASYWRFWNDYDAAESLLASSVPARITFFGRDFQVNTADREMWQRHLHDSDTASLKRYPGLNHYGIPTAGKRTPEEYGEPGDVSPELVGDIADWIHEL